MLLFRHAEAKVTEAFLRGEKYTPKGQPVTDVPQNFKDWVAGHAGQIAAARKRGTEPYFLKENRGYLSNKNVENATDTERKANEAVRVNKELIAEREALFNKLKSDGNYRDVAFNAVNGGVKATHVEHNFDKHKGGGTRQPCRM